MKNQINTHAFRTTEIHFQWVVKIDEDIVRWIWLCIIIKHTTATPFTSHYIFTGIVEMMETLLNACQILKALPYNIECYRVCLMCVTLYVLCVSPYQCNIQFIHKSKHSENEKKNIENYLYGCIYSHLVPKKQQQ